MSTVSRYKDPSQAAEFNNQWAQKLQQLSGLSLQPQSLPTDWGQTRVWVHTPQRRVHETLVFLPGFNASSLVWLVGQGLNQLSRNYRLCLIDINGQPGFSDGRSPRLHTDEYGQWACQVLEQLSITRATLIGHGLGGLIILKACRFAPKMVKKAILVNPAGLQSLRLSPALLRYTLLTVKTPSYSDVNSFLQATNFSSLDPPLTSAQEKLLVDFQVYALSSFDLAPCWFQSLAKAELAAVHNPIHIVLGTQDKFYPYQHTLAKATQHLSSLVSVTVLPTLGHSVLGSPFFFPTLHSLLAQ